jgi:hypothetical protein
MNRQTILSEVMKKQELSELPFIDVEKALNCFLKRDVVDEEKIKLTRELLHRVYGAFSSKKLFSLKSKNEEWILRKHLSTRERLPYYSDLYEKLLQNFNGAIFDFGSGVNGFSYKFLLNKNKYIAVEGVGQLVNLMNDYFKKNKINGKAIHLSLFDLEEIKKLLKNEKKEKLVFLFKVLDSLEMLERDYSKKLLMEITPLVKGVVVSFATRSMIKKTKFKARRNWIIDFIEENFKMVDSFEIGNELYIIFKK